MKYVNKSQVFKMKILFIIDLMLSNNRMFKRVLTMLKHWKSLKESLEILINHYFTYLVELNNGNYI